jgi:hypothetical protein
VGGLPALLNGSWEVSGCVARTGIAETRARLAAQMAKKLQPEDVFTPAAPVHPRVFATRRHEDLQDRVEQAINEKGRQVVL